MRNHLLDEHEARTHQEILTCTAGELLAINYAIMHPDEFEWGDKGDAENQGTGRP
jgi:hypothetical protein